MSAASGGSGENPSDEGEQPFSGGHEAPPIEDMPAYGGWPAATPPGNYPPPPPGDYPPSPQGYYPPPPQGYYPPPEYGAPYPGGYGYPAAPTGRTNSLAIISVVASVVGLLCGIGSIIGIVLGAVSLGQIRKTGEKGYGLAVAGIVIGVASLIISAVWLIFATGMNTN